MEYWSRTKSAVRNLFRKPQIESHLDQEIHAYVDMETMEQRVSDATAQRRLIMLLRDARGCPIRGRRLRSLRLLGEPAQARDGHTPGSRRIEKRIAAPDSHAGGAAVRPPFRVSLLLKQ
jgi:hypothetical protein